MTDQERQIESQKAPFDAIFPRLVNRDDTGHKLIGLLHSAFITARKGSGFQISSVERIVIHRTKNCLPTREPGPHLGSKRWRTLQLNSSRHIPTLWSSKQRRQILRSALRGSYWRAVGRWVGGALLYTFLLLAFAIGLAKSGIDLGGLYQKIVSSH
jgi:hypothetical protein